MKRIMLMMFIRVLVLWFASVTAAVAQVAGAGYVNPLSICPGYTYTYNLATGACSTNSPNTCASGGGTELALVNKLAVANSAATNSLAFTEFAKQAQYHTRPAVSGWYNGGYSTSVGTSAGDTNQATDASANNCIVAYIPSGGGTYAFGGAAIGNAWPRFIPRLKIYGDGGMAKLTNLQNTCGSSGCSGNNVDQADLHLNIDYITTLDVGAFNWGGYFIQSIGAGATSATLTGSAANAANYYVGGWILIASGDQQMMGYPPNFRYYDYAKVLSANSSTGVITWDTPTRFAHVGLSPGYTATTASNPYCVYNATTDAQCPNGQTSPPADGLSGTIGPARIIPIDTPSHPVQIYLEIDKIHFVTNPNYSGAGSQQNNECIQTGGQIDVSFSDLLMDQGMCTVMVRNMIVAASQWQGDESDKTINYMAWLGDRITYQDLSHDSQLRLDLIGNHISFTNTTYNGNGYMPQYMNASYNVFDSLLNNCNYFSASIYMGENYGQTQQVNVLNNTFVGSGQSCQTNNAPMNAPDAGPGKLGYLVVGATAEPSAVLVNSTELSAPIASGGTIPGGSNTYGGLGGTSSGAYYLATACMIGSPIAINNALVPGAFVSNLTGDGTNVYLTITGATLAATNGFQCPGAVALTDRNNQGVNTGYTWGSGGNQGVRNNSAGLLTVTAGNNSGN